MLVEETGGRQWHCACWDGWDDVAPRELGSHWRQPGVALLCPILMKINTVLLLLGGHGCFQPRIQRVTTRAQVSVWFCIIS